MRGTMHAIAMGCLAWASACGGAEQNAEEPTPTTQATVVKATDAGGEAPAPTRIEVDEAVPGVAKIQLARFVDFVGFHHGDNRDAATPVLAWKAEGLGARKPLEMSGSEGFRFPGHLAISWSTETQRIDYVSVRSKAAVQYLAGKGRSDSKLDALFGASISVARSALGKPTLEAQRPHAVTYRYDFDAGGKKGTVTLEFDRLVDPPTCRSVSVHWR